MAVQTVQPTVRQANSSTSTPNRLTGASHNSLHVGAVSAHYVSGSDFMRCQTLLTVTPLGKPGKAVMDGSFQPILVLQLPPRSRLAKVA